jgi:uncharacterized protein (TIRG00374 family)
LKRLFGSFSRFYSSLRYGALFSPEKDTEVNGLTDKIEQDPRSGNWLRREWRLLVGLALSAICLFLAFRGISLPALVKALSAARWEWVALAVAVVVVSTFVKAVRWQALFFPQRLSVSKAWSIFMIGQMLNAVLPARAGEVGRIYFIGEVEGISRAQALSTVVVEKVVDLVMLALAYLVVAVWLVVTSTGFPNWLRDAGVSLFPLAALGLGSLLLFVYAGRPTWRFLRQVLKPLPLNWRTAADAAAEQSISAFEALRRWQTSAQVWSWSILIWALATLIHSLVFIAFHLSLSPYLALLLLVVLMSGVSVPPLPGNLGVFPYLCVLVLSLFGVNRETALVYGIVLQMVAYFPLIVLGSGCMLWENRSSRRSSLMSREVRHEDAQS